MTLATIRKKLKSITIPQPTFGYGSGAKWNVSAKDILGDDNEWYTTVTFMITFKTTFGGISHTNGIDLNIKAVTNDELPEIAKGVIMAYQRIVENYRNKEQKC